MNVKRIGHEAVSCMGEHLCMFRLRTEMLQTRTRGVSFCVSSQEVLWWHHIAYLTYNLHSIAGSAAV